MQNHSYKEENLMNRRHTLIKANRYMMVDRPRNRHLLLIICLFMTTDTRNCSDNFSRSISSTPVGTTEIENKSKNIGWNTDRTVLVAEIENRTDAIG